MSNGEKVPPPAEEIEKGKDALVGYEIEGMQIAWRDVSLERAEKIMYAFVEKVEQNPFDRDRRMKEVDELMKDPRSETLRLKSGAIKMHLLSNIRPGGKVWSVVVEPNWKVDGETFRDLIFRHLSKDGGV